MIDKEEACRTIFGLGRADGCTLNSLTETQETAILEVLLHLDQIDELIDVQSRANSIQATFIQIGEKCNEVITALPDRDLRGLLLRETYKAYENWLILTKGADLNQLNEDAIAILAIARMRKLFLRNILNNDLDSNGQDLVNYLIGPEVANQTESSAHSKIPLPQATAIDGAKAHPFPFQVSFQTQEFIQAVLFYSVFADTAAGEYVRLPNALKTIQERLIEEGLEKRLWDRGWEYLEKYKQIFNNTIFQNVAILMRSHWDWYIRQIGEFVSFARVHVASPALDQKQQTSLERIGRNEIRKQLFTLRVACGIDFDIPESVLLDLTEMSLVRNLGLHNRWEVDEFYLRKTMSPDWELRDVRLIEVAELQSWATSLSKLINDTSLQIATKYAAAPAYP